MSCAYSELLIVSDYGLDRHRVYHHTKTEGRSKQSSQSRLPVLQNVRSIERATKGYAPLSCFPIVNRNSSTYTRSLMSPRAVSYPATTVGHSKQCFRLGIAHASSSSLSNSVRCFIQNKEPQSGRSVVCTNDPTANKAIAAWNIRARMSDARGTAF